MLIEGYNITTLAYGVTGAGKTFTMLGDGFENTGDQVNQEVSNPGLTFLTLQRLFELLIYERDTKGGEFDIKIAYLEVYNEKVFDLLRNDQRNNLVILEDPKIGAIIPGLKRCKVKNIDEAVMLVRQGNERRTMAATHSNQFSSRSHAIIQI